MKIKDTFHYTIPVLYISAIENADRSALSGGDEQALDSFIDTLEEGGTWEWPENIDREKYFAYTNDVHNLGDDVVNVKYHTWEVR